MRESTVQKMIMLALSEAGCLVFRNTSGSYTDPRSGSFIRYGVGSPGGSDLIGLTPTGKFMAIEVKNKTGRPSAAQLQFIEAVRAKGGIAGVCRSPEEALNLINQ